MMVHGFDSKEIKKQFKCFGNYRPDFRGCYGFCDVMWLCKAAVEKREKLEIERELEDLI